MTTLVTGAAGFVGANVVKALVEAGESVVAFDRAAPDDLLRRFTTSNAAQVIWAQGDIRDREALIELARQQDVRRIAHLAALTPTPDVERAHSADIVEVNLTGTLNALGAARLVDAERIVCLSSSALYGAPTGDPRQPVTETAPTQQRNLYTICKYAGEQLCRRYAELHGLSAISARLGAVYGPMERPSATRPNVTHIYHLVQAALEGRSPSVRGLPLVREWTHIGDAARAIVALSLIDSPHHDLYNVSSSCVYSFTEVLTALSRAEPSFRYTEAAEGDAADLVMVPEDQRAPLDTSRLRGNTGFAPRFDLEAGLRDYLDWSRRMLATQNN